MIYLHVQPTDKRLNIKRRLKHKSTKLPLISLSILSAPCKWFLNSYLEEIKRKRSKLSNNLACRLLLCRSVEKHSTDEEFDQNLISKYQDTINNLSDRICSYSFC